MNDTSYRIVTLCLAIFGSAGTLYTLISAFIVNRVNLELKIEQCTLIQKDSASFYVSICNRSRLPISITDICVYNHDRLYSCNHIPTLVLTRQETSGNTVVHREDYKSLPIPISLSSLAGISGYLSFSFPLADFEVPDQLLTFQISTNRHKRQRMTLQLHQDTENALKN